MATTHEKDYKTSVALFVHAVSSNFVHWSQLVYFIYALRISVLVQNDNTLVDYLLYNNLLILWGKFKYW